MILPPKRVPQTAGLWGQAGLLVQEALLEPRCLIRGLDAPVPTTMAGIHWDHERLDRLVGDIVRAGRYSDCFWGSISFPHQACVEHFSGDQTRCWILPQRARRPWMLSQVDRRGYTSGQKCSRNMLWGAC